MARKRKRKSHITLFVLLAFVVLGFFGAAGNKSGSDVSQTNITREIPKQTAAATPVTPKPTATIRPTKTPKPSSTPKPTVTANPTQRPTTAPTQLPTSTPTAVPTTVPYWYYYTESPNSIPAWYYDMETPIQTSAVIDAFYQTITDEPTFIERSIPESEVTPIPTAVVAFTPFMTPTPSSYPAQSTSGESSNYGPGYFPTAAVISTPIPGTNYVLNTKSMVFHNPGCKDVGKMSDANRTDYFGVRDEIISMGYKPCGHCHP